MATIIDRGDGSFIAGDPEPELGEREHWCVWCFGSGMERDEDFYPTICSGCDGSGVRECDEDNCAEHFAP